MAPPEAQCTWISTLNIQGSSEKSRQGHAIAVKGNSVFLFGGSNTSKDGETVIYHNDLHLLTVNEDGLVWKTLYHKGAVPCKRDSHSLCVVENKLYLFGGKDTLTADECLLGFYILDIDRLEWKELKAGGVAPRTLSHTCDAVGSALYVFGGLFYGTATNNTLTYSMPTRKWIPLNVCGPPPAPRCDHASTVIGSKIYYFGGCGGENVWYNDVHALDTDTLSWIQLDVQGKPPPARACHTFTAHRDKDIYIFGGSNDDYDDGFTTFNDLYKLSLAKKQWKRPMYSGILASRRYSHVACIIHSHLYIIGGMSDDGELEDINVLKLINPSERVPVMKDLMQDFGVTGCSTAMKPTKTPKLTYDLEHPPYFKPEVKKGDSQYKQIDRDFGELRKLMKSSVDKACDCLEEEFSKIQMEKTALHNSRCVLEQERKANNQLYSKQQQEIETVIHRHKDITNNWLQSRQAENDEERRKLTEERSTLSKEKVQVTRERIELSKKHQELYSILHQFKDV